MNKKILIDTDPGIDDALALILALKSNLDIKTISTVAGNVGLSQTQANARHILKILNCSLKPLPGSAQPIDNKLTKALVHGKSGLGNINISPKPTKPDLKQISKQIKTKQINTIISLGPLTNIGKILQSSPKIEKQINKIVIMGGAIKSPGNVTSQAEFNFYVDPKAAQIVLNSKIKKVLIPLNACHQVILPWKYFKQIGNKKLRSFMLSMVKEYITNNQKQGLDGATMYDPLTAYYLLNKQAYKTKKHNLKIITEGEKRGKTVVDKNGSKVEVAVDIDKDKFKKDFLKIVNGSQT